MSRVSPSAARGKRWAGVWILGFLGLALVPGCRGEAGPTLPVRIEVATAPTPAIVGPNLLVLEVRDLEDRPVEGARLQVEGTMTHAGMVPVFADAEETAPGMYRVSSFPFTMGGDWVLLLHLTLPGGETGTLSHPLRVISAPNAEGEGR
jgi:hypothetical protein